MPIQAPAAAVAEFRELGRTVLVVTHDHSVLDRFDHVVDLGTLAQAAVGGGS